MLGQIDYLWEGLLTWALVGAFVGYMMGFFSTELNEGKSVLGDIAAGVLGALISGFAVHYFVAGRPGFYLSVAVAAPCAFGAAYAWRSAMTPGFRLTRRP